MMSHSQLNVPVLLLKTRSSPHDAYEELFASQTQPPGFRPIFLPVLAHRFTEAGLTEVMSLLDAGAITDERNGKYGGLIFTSQRAVEAFGHVAGNREWPCLGNVPVYSVGPATTRALKALPIRQPLKVFGEHTGNGENLAHFILDHYSHWYEARPHKPVLFLVGEQRRDIIPKTLMDPALAEDRQIQVREIEVYETGVMESFKDDFTRVLSETSGAPTRWVVVFSPTGCDAMLQALGLLDDRTGKAKTPSMEGGRNTFIATIGPTTASHLRKQFDLEPDVCADQPSPEGVLRGITEFSARLER